MHFGTDETKMLFGNHIRQARKEQSSGETSPGPACPKPGQIQSVEGNESTMDSETQYTGIGA